MPAAIVVALLLVAALVIAVPVRRLAQDGRSRTMIVSYVVLLVALAVGVSELRPLARYLLPVLGVVYIVPFITWQDGLDRLLGRRRPSIRVVRVERPSVDPPRDVTPPDDPTRDSEDPTGQAEDPTGQAEDPIAERSRPRDTGA
ncbi:MAG: hypothetical protein ACHQ3P_03760 [Candidatus Limnocylindrales bacterium]